MITSIFAATGLFTLRLVALYKNKRYLIWFIITFYLATYITTYGLAIGSTIALAKFPTSYSELVKSCVSLGTTPLMLPIWYAPLAYEAFLFSLTAYRAWYDAKVISGENAPFLVLFYRDGLIAFIVMTGVRVWNVWIYLTQPPSNLFVGVMLMWAINTVLTTRVYMNLVWLVRRPNQVTGISTSATIGLGGSVNIEMRAPRSIL